MLDSDDIDDYKIESTWAGDYVLIQLYISNPLIISKKKASFIDYIIKENLVRFQNTSSFYRKSSEYILVYKRGKVNGKKKMVVSYRL